MKKRTTMQNIADRLDISKVSVSKALGNQPGVSDDLRKLIISTASKMGYVPNQLPSEKKKFAFVVPKRFFLETDKFYNVIFYYMNGSYLRKNTTLVPVIVNIKTEDSADDYGFYEEYDGIFLTGELSDKYTSMISGTGKPIVAIDFYKTDLDVPCVLIDNFHIGHRVTRYLIERGHRDIGFVGNINQTSSISDRYYGYLKALQEINVSLCDDWIISNNDARTGLYEINTALPSVMPTAFVCHCDMAAYFLSCNLQNKGIAIPGDVSLISFDNTELSKASGLTSVDIDKRDIASTAIRAMDMLIRNEEYRNRYYVSTKLISRDSVKSLM
ncbi:MAG: LacI family DNA-binding transcriptional regulator [Oscillospiraceae bacterium]|nr:LacI family DNA-binding transcriptional regulator [Oscillospiraceae bacterium]